MKECRQWAKARAKRDRQRIKSARKRRCSGKFEKTEVGTEPHFWSVEPPGAWSATIQDRWKEKTQ
jgi:hypothetical protein